MDEKKDKIVYIQLDNWNNMGAATEYLNELENGEHDNEINYTDVWYDMAIIHCITTTKDYVKEHPELEEHIENLNRHDTFASYYPKYDPNNFGCNWHGEYQGWAPYKDFNRQIAEYFQKQNKQNNEQHCNNNPEEN